MNNEQNQPTPKPLPKWTEKLFALIYKHWQYHALCVHINIQAFFDHEEKVWQVKAAPVFQEVYGGDEDGKKVWAGFIFDIGDFSRETGVWVEHFAIASYCQECSEHPKLMVRGKFRGHQFFLHIFLEPIAETDAVEVLDTLQHEIREMPDKEE